MDGLIEREAIRREEINNINDNYNHYLPRKAMMAVISSMGYSAPE